MTAKSATAVFLIDFDLKSASAIQTILKSMPGIDLNVETGDTGQAYSRIRDDRPSIVILNLHPDEGALLDFAQRINRQYPECVLIITSKTNDSSTVIQAMRAGAREFLLQPVDKNELVSAIQNIMKSLSKTTSRDSANGKILTFFGTKGGIGTTTLATNVATSLALRSKTDIILVDLNLQFGNAPLFLNVKTTCSILDIAKNIDEIDESLLKKRLPRSQSGVVLLTGPERIEEAETITAENIEQILTKLKQFFHYIVIDTNPVFNDITLKAMDESEHIFIVSHFDVPSIFNTRRCLAVLKKIGYDDEKVKLVVNRYTLFNDIDIAAMEKLIDYPIYWKLPNEDNKHVTASVNRGIPICALMPHSKLSQNFFKMTAQLNGHIPDENREEKTSKRKSLIRKLR